VPIVADVHFHYEMARRPEAGVTARLNPGTLKLRRDKACPSERRPGVPIRVGVNAGSLHPSLYKKYGGATPERSRVARMELAYFDESASRT